MTPSPHRRAVVAVLSTLLLSPLATTAHETDQYTIRHIEIVDSTDVLNEGFNRMLAEVAADWNGGPNQRAFAKRVYKKMGGRHYIDKYERWARKNPDIPMIEIPRKESIYQGGPFWSTRVVFFFGLGPVIRLNEQLVGYDKMGHFLSSGWKYHKKHLQGGTEEQVLAMGHRFESGIFGFLTTGVFSNADLVANYEGYQFFRSLFEDDIVAGKPAIIAFDGKNASVQRPFDWRDHVNAFWDEALNPSIYDKLLRDRVVNHLEELCPVYAETPEEFAVPNEEELVVRYAHLDLRDATEFSLATICAEEPEAGTAVAERATEH